MKQWIRNIVAQGKAAGFPRPRGRGPVEAEVLPEVQAIHHANFRARAGAAPLKHGEKNVYRFTAKYFRARAGAAPLKPYAPRNAKRQAAAFPRPRGRGPVEASNLASSPRVNRFYFRARAGAAPLKRVIQSAPFPNGCYFRARAGAAPLKLAMANRPLFE